MSLLRLLEGAWKDRLKGGEADEKTPADFPKKKLDKGAAHEREHTADARLGKEIAMDHLADDPDYYEKLAGVEDEKKDDDDKVDEGTLSRLFEKKKKKKRGGRGIGRHPLGGVYWWGAGHHHDDDGNDGDGDGGGDGGGMGESLDETFVLDKTADKIAARIKDAAQDHRDVRLVFPSRKVRDGFVDVMKAQGLRYGKDVSREPEDDVASVDAGTLVSKNLVDRLSRALEAYGGGTEMTREMQAPTNPSFYRRKR